MPESLPEHEPVIADEVMWRIRYRPEELKRNRSEALPWYRSIPVGELDALDPELRAYLQMQADNINDPEAQQITVPTAYTNGKFSHVQRLSRDMFEIPGGLSLRGNDAERLGGRPEEKSETGRRLARLFKKRRPLP